jgi:predicted lipid carrier protein YhbT
MQPLPLEPLRWALARVLRSVASRHPGLFQRLGPHAHKRFGIEPTDLPFAFVIAPHPRTPTIAVMRALPRDVSVRIAGPLIALLGLIDGSYDGDALFFSRDLVIEGDMEAVLALRNAIEDAGVDLVADTAVLFGPFAPLSQSLLRGALSRLQEVASAISRVEARRWS